MYPQIDNCTLADLNDLILNVLTCLGYDLFDARRVDATVPMVFSADETADVGSDTGTPVTDDIWASPARALGSMSMHWSMAGGWWPSHGLRYREPIYRTLRELALASEAVLRTLDGRDVRTVVVRAPRRAGPSARTARFLSPGGGGSAPSATPRGSSSTPAPRVAARPKATTTS